MGGKIKQFACITDIGETYQAACQGISATEPPLFRALA